MTDMNAHLDEGMIHAWLDGELAPDESARVEAHAQGCPDCAALVAEARGLIAASTRILASLDAVPADVIPGIDRDADQLAVLRARKNAASRRWWSDRRVVAAATLLFIAGTFSVVWRASSNQPQLAESSSAAPTAESASSAAVAQREAAPPAVTDAARDTKPEAPAPAPPSPARVAANRALDSIAEAKVAATGAAADVRRVSGAANEMARRVDVASPRQEQAQAQAPVQVQASAQVRVDSLQRMQAAKQQVGFQALRMDTGRVAAAAPPGEVGARSLAPAPTTSAARRMSDAASVAGCYILRTIEPGRLASASADSVRLLDEVLARRSDPAWFRAVRLGVPPDTTSLGWRALDGITVELRGRGATDSTALRFRPSDGGAPDVRGLRGVRAATAIRFNCP
jgi:hypothetical protein